MVFEGKIVGFRENFWIFAGLTILATMNVWTSAALAQQAITPGQVLESVRQRPAEPLPDADSAPVISTETAAPQQLDPDAPRFLVQQFVIVGNAIISTEELHDLIADAEGKPYNLHDLQAVLDRITQHYRSNGYLVARAVLPAQKVTDGNVIIEVIEGRIDQAKFSGNRRYSDAVLGRWGQPLADQQVRLSLFEERMLVINDLPGMTARAVLRPGATYGTTTTEIIVDEDPVDGRVSLNNHGRKDVGEHRLDAAVQFNNPLGFGDQLGLQASQSENDLLTLYGVSYSFPINVYGTRINLSYTHVDYDVGGDLRSLDLSGESNIGSLSISHPLHRSRTENLYGTLAVRAFSGEQFFSSQPLSESDVVLLEAGLAWNRVHADSSISVAGLRVSSNFRDSDEGTRDNAQLFKIDGEYQYLMRLSARWQLKLGTAAMWSPDALVDAERFSLGGPASVRGYPSAWVLGDRGVFGSVEARYRFDLISMPTMFSVFTDAGYVKRRYAAAGTPESADLSSIGAGLQFAPASWLNAELAGAIPTGDDKDADNRAGGRVWFSLTANF